MTEPEPQPVTTHASIVDLVSRILPGDIIQVDGQKIVIPGSCYITIYESYNFNGLYSVGAKIAVTTWKFISRIYTLVMLSRF